MLIRKSESASGSTLVTDQAQNVYELVIASYGQRPSELAEQYRLVGETYFAFQWANSIGLNDFQWHQIFSGLLAHIHSNSIAHEVAELIASGKVRVYELPSIKSSGAIPFDEKSAYQFFPSVVTQYAASPYRLEKFNSVAKAQAFVNGIKWSGSALARVASDLRMDQIIQQKIIKNGSSNLEFGKQEIIKLLSEGKAVVLKVERITASPSKKSAAELVPLRTNDKPPPLAPETKNTEAVQEEKKSDLDEKKDVEPKSSGDATNSKAMTDFVGDTETYDVGRLGGKLYSPKKLAQLEKYLSRRGIELRVGDEHVPFGKAGGFNAEKGFLILRDNPTNYEVWHELSHFRQYQQLGKEAYLNLPRTTNFNAPEQFVFDMLENSPKRWNSLNFDEQQHAIRYIENVGGFR